MKKISGFLIIAMSSLCMTAFAQFDLKGLENKATNAVSGTPLSSDDVGKGLKEALTTGSKNSSQSASQVDGYFKNANIKIPFPPEAKNMETRLRGMGMGDQVDKFVLASNRAAEDAAKEAAAIFVDAITKMTITDAMSILKGNNDAATVYLKKTTSDDLRAKFKPIVVNSIQKVEVTKYWNPLVTTYNKIPFITKVNPNLEDYITQKALDGLFYLVAQEELKIRTDPAARVTDILKQVFGQ